MRTIVVRYELYKNGIQTKKKRILIADTIRHQLNKVDFI